METLSGVVATFDKAIVVRRDVDCFARIRDELVELTVEYGQVNLLEISINGYDDDNRSLYEVPEVNKWIKIINTRWPDFLFWLTPGSLWLCMLCLNPGMHPRLPDGRLQISLNIEELASQFAWSAIAAEKVLRNAGMPNEQIDRVAEQVNPNLLQMSQRKSIGRDYVLVHPKDGQVRIYQMV